MDKATKNALLYTAGLAAVYLGYKHYKSKQGELTQTPTDSQGTKVPATSTATSTSQVKASPMFSSGNTKYVTKVKVLQALLKVKVDGIIGPETKKAAAAIGITYTIHSSTIDKAILTASNYSHKQSPKKDPVAQIVQSLSNKKPVKFVEAVNSMRYVLDKKTNSYVKANTRRLFAQEIGRAHV